MMPKRHIPTGCASAFEAQFEARSFQHAGSRRSEAGACQRSRHERVRAGVGPQPVPGATLRRRHTPNVTIQDEHCRCLVASAPLWDGSILPTRNGVPQHCLSTDLTSWREQCARRIPRSSTETSLSLSSPLNHWVELNYRVRAGRLNPGAVEVYEGTRFIVRVTGKIGYEAPAGMRSLTKFKIGHYRDYMPHTDQMDIDRVSIEPH